MWLKEQVLDAVRLKGIQETIAGFLNDQVLDSGGECYFNPQEQMKPNNDDHLYDAWVAEINCVVNTLSVKHMCKYFIMDL